MRKNTDFFQFLVMKGKGLWLVSKTVHLYIVAYNTFTIITKFKVLGEKIRKSTWREKPQLKAAETRRQNNFESLEMLQSEVFQIFCIIYSSLFMHPFYCTQQFTGSHANHSHLCVKTFNKILVMGYCLSDCVCFHSAAPPNILTGRINGVIL